MGGYVYVTARSRHSTGVTTVFGDGSTRSSATRSASMPGGTKFGQRRRNHRWPPVLTIEEEHTANHEAQFGRRQSSSLHFSWARGVFSPLTGCGGDGLRKIHGTVTYRGKPIAKDVSRSCFPTGTARLPPFQLSTGNTNCTSASDANWCRSRATR